MGPARPDCEDGAAWGPSLPLPPHREHTPLARRSSWGQTLSHVLRTQYSEKQSSLTGFKVGLQQEKLTEAESTLDVCWSARPSWQAGGVGLSGQLSTRNNWDPRQPGPPSVPTEQCPVTTKTEPVKSLL